MLAYVTELCSLFGRIGVPRLADASVRRRPMTNKQHASTKPEESKSEEFRPTENDRDELAVTDALAVLDENDGKPRSLLKHRELRYEIAEWKHTDDPGDCRYSDLIAQITWQSGAMNKKRFENKLDTTWEELRDEETEHLEDEVPSMSAKEFEEAFAWDAMDDREIAHKCHLWARENADIIYSNEQILVYDGDVWIRDEHKIPRILQQLVGENYGDNLRREFLEGYVKSHDDYQVEWKNVGIQGSRCLVENGILDLVEGEIIRDARPDDYALFKLPVEWHGIDAERELWEDQFLGYSVDPDDRYVLQEYTGILLHTNEYPFKKALMMLGGGNNGKGVYEDVVTAMLGSENVMHDDLADMSSNRFGLQRLRYRVANINSDIEGGTIDQTALFKKLTGRDRIRVEPKYERAFSIRNPAKLVFAANRVPDVDDAQLPFFARWLFVEFPNQFTFEEGDGKLDAIRRLDEKIIENELPGVLAWAVEGYQRLHRQDRFSTDRSPEQIRDQWHNYSDTTATFVRNYVKTPSDPAEDEIRVDELYDLYEKYISTTPTPQKSKQSLNAYIQNRYEHAETKTSRQAVRDREDKEVVRVWDGVTIPHKRRKKIREEYTETL